MNVNAAIACLLIDHGASVHIADSNGWTVLHAASRRRGDVGISELLFRQ
jgi:ankyrin repeat protein